MRTILCSLFITALALGAANAQDLKVGIVDMTKVFQDYYKTKDAEKKVNDGKAIAKKELDERNARYKQLIEKYQALAAEIKDPSMSEELRAVKQKDAEDVASEARSLEREKKEFAERRQRQLLEQVERMRKAIMFNRKEGYEVRLMIQKVCNTFGFATVEDVKKVESVIANELPGSVRSRENVYNWLVDYFTN